MKKIFLDFETRSHCDIKKSGGFKYASDHTTEILCACWKVEGEKEVRFWSPFLVATDKITSIFDLLATGEYIIEAHNAHFEWSMWNYCAVKKYNFPKVSFEQFSCTAARAAALSLPRDLEGVAKALGLPVQKDMAGRRVMLKMCKPNKEGKWYEDANDFDTLIHYCELDVLVTEQVSNKIPELSETEKAIFQLDFKINRKGVLLDIPNVERAIQFAEIYSEGLNAELAKLTNWEVTSSAQNMKLTKWFNDQGLMLPDVAKDTVTESLLYVKDETCRRVLEIRQALALSSVKKLYSMLAMGMRDNRARGTLLYAGANRTGRWCLAPMHEVLTLSGWVTLENWKGGAIAQWDDGKITFQKAIPNSFDFEGEMLQLQSYYIDQIMTPDHMLPMLNDRGTRFNKKAEDIINRAHSKLFCAGEIHPSHSLEARIKCMVQADGHYSLDPREGRFLRFRFVKERKIERCKKLLTESGIKFDEATYPSEPTVRVIIIRWRDMPQYLLDFTDKTFKNEDLKYSSSIIDEVVNWDGDWNSDSSFTYSTNNQTNADFIITCAALNGFRGRKEIAKNRNPKWNISYRIFITIGYSETIHRKNWTKVPYKGKVYCPTTKTGFFLVRHNGKVSITGNSGKGIQIQNLPRGSIQGEEIVEALTYLSTCTYNQFKERFPNVLGTISSLIRSFIKAPDGKKLMIGDFSAIEAKMVFWLSGHEKGLDIYRSGRDPYKDMAAYVYKKKYDDVTKQERQLGKAIILGCVAEGTKVLTENGYKKIEEISLEDKLWDGKKWRQHEGVFQSGQKSVIRIANLNIELTPDHWVLSPQGWLAAGELAIREDIQLQLLETETVNLKLYPKNLKEAQNAVFISAAYAEMKKKFEWINSGEVKTFYATHVRNQSWVNKEGGRECEIFSLIQNLENVGQLVSTILKRDVSTLVMITTKGTVVAGLKYPSTAPEIFWNTLLLSMGLINGVSRWTELIMTETTSVEILESYLNPKITKIVQTYDILEVEETNRFQIKNAIVHNCGFAMGHKKFRETVALAPYNLILTEDEAKEAVEGYRMKHAPVKALWYELDNACKEAIKNPSKVYHVGKVSVTKRDNFLYIKLPSGRKLAYHKPIIRMSEKDWGTVEQIAFWGVDQETHRWGLVDTFGGKLVENCLGPGTLVLTSTGYKKITHISSKDNLWDGQTWVQSDGIVFKGIQETIKWNGVQVTKDHLISNGKEWNTVINSTEEDLQQGLKLVQSSMNLPSFKAGLERTQSPIADVYVGPKYLYLIRAFQTVRLKIALNVDIIKRVLKEVSTLISQQIGDLFLHGIIGTRELCLDVIIPSVLPSKTMAAEELKCTNLGYKIKNYSLNLLKHYPVGIKKEKTSIELITMGITNQGIYDSFQEKKIVEIEEPVHLSRYLEKLFLLQNLWKSILPHGKVLRVWHTIYEWAVHLKKLVFFIRKNIPVYDVLNSGPNHCFTILTTKGPLLVHNCTQATARDMMAYSMIELDKVGYDINMLVHDEIVSETVDGTVDQYKKIMETLPSWAMGFPGGAEVEETVRYKK